MYMNTLGDRIKKAMQMRDIRISDICDVSGKKQSSISHYLTNRTFPNEEFFTALTQLMPDLNLHWILTGKGEMFFQGGSTGEIDVLKAKLDEAYAREKEMTTALMNLSKAIGRGESAKFNTVCEKTGVSMERVNGRWSLKPKHTSEHTVRFAV